MAKILLNKKFINYSVKNPSLLLHLRKTYTNIFFTLTNSDATKVVYCVSAGLCCSGNKRRKVSPQTVELMNNRLLDFLRKYKFRTVLIIIKSSIPSYIRTLVKDFKSKGFPIFGFANLKKVAHNGVRGRKIRRK